MKILNKFNKWFELNLGWVFVNGRKREEWNDYLKGKYNPTDNNMFQGPTKL
jgi:hypothetical protein